MQINTTGLSADELLDRLPDFIGSTLLNRDIKERAKLFTGIMNTARELGIAEQAYNIAQETAKRYNEPELWEEPETFEKSVSLTSFPIESLPPVLSEFLKAVSDYVQVYPEIAVLPLFSVLSLCVQGKAVVKHPGNNHTETLNLYTMTVAAPGERKSGSFKAFMKPVEEYQKHYNAIHKNEIEQYKTEKAFIERQKQAAICGKNASIEKAKEFTLQLSELKEKHELRLNVNDVTPEALAWEMYLQGGRIGVIDDEGSVFDVLSGLYSGGSANINIFLKAYDGTNYSVIRRTKEEIILNNPLLTMGIMTQPEHFAEALSNKQFSGRGFIHRFLFSFPESKAGYQSFTSTNIPNMLQVEYTNLINRLLNMPYPDNIPVINCSREAFNLLSDYYNHLQEEMREGRSFERLKEWASKQFARCLKITAILHLCEYDTNDLITGKEAFNGINISMWCENQALKAFSGAVSDPQEVKNAKYIINRLKKDRKDSYYKRDFLRLCRAISAEDTEEALQLLEDMNIIKREIISNPGAGRPKENIKVNPLI